MHFGLLRLRDPFPGLHFAVDQHVAETIFQQVAFRLERSQRVLKLIRQDELEWRFWYTKGTVSNLL